MKKNNLKILLLIVLIITSIIQTSVLWLGDMPSHNFLESTSAQVGPILPENIFRNKGDPFTVSYRIDEGSGEYERFVKELSGMLAKYSKTAKLSLVEPLDWDSILAMQGVLYEYTIPVSLDELATTKVGIDEVGFINNVFLTLDDSIGNKAKLYLINETDDLCYKLDITGEFLDLVKLYNGFNIEEVGDSITKYQPSTKAMNISRYIEGNVFMPLTSETVPLEYEVLRLINPVDVYEDNKQIVLDKYTSELFNKPILKEIEYREDGSVVFTESMKSMVIYRPTGVIEYINLDVTRGDKVMSMLEGYNIATAFIQNSSTIPETTRDRLYLTDITQVDKEYTFNFDLKYNGYKIIVSPSVKEELGLNHMVELTIKDGQIIGGKWSIRELQSISNYEEISMKEIKIGYGDPINKMYAGLQEGQETPLLEDIATVYEVQELDKEIEMKWGVFYDEMWYYP
ncbi:MAG: hypothetical protein RR324_07390 [Cellulosilyticaceae bacterium]